MGALLPCSRCGRHVRVSSRACPFCLAAVTFAPVALVATLALAGCNQRSQDAAPGDSPAPSAAPSAPPSTSAAETIDGGDIGQNLRDLEKELRDQRALYGSPPRRDSGPNKPCDCTATDPLCTCQ